MTTPVVIAHPSVDRKETTRLRRAILIGQMAYDGEADRVDEFVQGPKIGTSVPRLTAKVGRIVGLFKKDAARVEDPISAARYSLSILHRRAPARTEKKLELATAKA